MVRFSDLLPEPEQQRWLYTGHSTALRAQRRERDDLNPVYWGRFVRLMETPEADGVLALMRRYVALAIPDAARCEGRFWTCSCFPSKALAGDRDYVRINVNWQEVLCVFSENDTLIYRVYLARSPLAERFGPMSEGLSRTFAGVEARATSLVAGGTDQCQVRSFDVHALLAAMDDEDVQYAIRVLNMRLLNRGVCPFARYHNWLLADEIFSS